MGKGRGLAAAVAGLAVACVAGAPAWAASAPARALSPHQALARDIFEELVEIDTTPSAGDTYRAALAMAARLKAGGFPDGDVQAIQTAPRKGNLVARLRGTGAGKPILMLAHIDVVEAPRAEWGTPPFELVEKDGWFYGRGTMDDKYMSSALIANLIRYRQEGLRPARDIIVALTADEEISDAQELGIRWLIKNRRDLIDAGYAINESGHVGVDGDKVLWNSIQTSQKTGVRYRLQVTNPGGHVSLPVRENAIYRLSAGLLRLQDFDFPIRLDETNRRYFEVASTLEAPQVAADMRAILAPVPDAAAGRRLADHPSHNARLRTTCVAIRSDAGHADNALPQLASAVVYCLLLPGETAENVRQTLVRVLADERISVVREDSGGLESLASPAPPELFALIAPLSERFWPGKPLIPIMTTGGNDANFLRHAGIPAYGHTGLAYDIFDIRAHGKDERITVKAFYDGTQYLYELVKILSADTTVHPDAGSR